MLKSKKMLLICVISILLSIINIGCSEPEYQPIIDYVSFNTVSQIIIPKELNSPMSQNEYDKLKEYFTQRLSHLSKLFDIYYEYNGVNNLRTININAAKTAVKVDKEILDLLELSKEAFIKTDGKVNIAYGSVLSIWHNYREEGTRVPTIKELSEAASHTNIDNIIIDRENGTVFLKDKNMSLDVGAIAKGYAAQLIYEELKAMGYDALVIDLGGNVKLLEGRDKNKDRIFRIGITDPNELEKNPPDTIAQLESGSLVSSGDYHRFYTVDNQRYHHIIDPLDNMPARYHRGVTVICDNSMLADVYSTHLFLISLEEGRNFCLSNGIEAIWFEADGEVVFTDGFYDLLSE